jgi:DNA-binding phage protein
VPEEALHRIHESRINGVVRTFISFVVRNAEAHRTVAWAALQCGVHRRKLSRDLLSAGAPSYTKLLRIGRLLHLQQLVLATGASLSSCRSELGYFGLARMNDLIQANDELSSILKSLEPTPTRLESTG